MGQVIAFSQEAFHRDRHPRGCGNRNGLVAGGSVSQHVADVYGAIQRIRVLNAQAGIEAGPAGALGEIEADGGGDITLRKTSPAPLVSPGTGFVASDSKAT